MSGIYIPGMEMPTSCRKCGLMMNCDDCEGWECYCLPLKKSIGHLEKFRDEPYVLTDKRRDDCPLLHVPEHGRLADTDVMCNECRRVAEEYDGIHPDCTYCPVHLAPTIIPADKETEK